MGSWLGKLLPCTDRKWLIRPGAWSIWWLPTCINAAVRNVMDCSTGHVYFGVLACRLLLSQEPHQTSQGILDLHSILLNDDNILCLPRLEFEKSRSSWVQVLPLVPCTTAPSRQYPTSQSLAGLDGRSEGPRMSRDLGTGLYTRNVRSTLGFFVRLPAPKPGSTLC